MELKQIKYFITIVEEGNISAAAKRLHISQPPLSLSLKLLEEELGVQLIERGARKCSLTDAGRIFYNRALNIYNLSDSAVTELADFKEGRRGTLRLGISADSSCGLVLGKIAEFNKKYPENRFEISRGNNYELEEMLLNGVIELAFIRTPFTDDQLNTVYLNREPMLAAGTETLFGKLLISGGKEVKGISLEQLNRQPLVICRTYESLLTAMCAERGFMPDIICRTEDVDMSLDLASKGMGITLLPESLLDDGRKDVLCSAVLEVSAFYSELALVSRKNSFLSWSARAFSSMVSGGR